MPRPIKCSRTAYTTAKAGTLNTPAQAVVTGITEHAALFPMVPVPPAIFGSLISTYSTTYSAYKSGGMAQKPAFEQAKTALLDAMNSTATYVDSVAQGDANIIMFAGFVPTKGTASSAPAPVPATGLRAWRGATGELYFECDNQDVADAYGAIVTEGAPLPADISMNSSGQIIVSDSERMIPSPPPAGGGQPEPPQLTTTFATMSSMNITMVAFDFSKARRKRLSGPHSGPHLLLRLLCAQRQRRKPALPGKEHTVLVGCCEAQAASRKLQAISFKPQAASY
jgi:hypothetical protein